jgi:hypothetical protein
MRDTLIRQKEEDIKSLKGAVDRALERERNMQYALEEQRQVSNLLRDQMNREKDENEAAHQTIAQKDDQISECRTQAERDKEKQRRLEADLHEQHKNVAQLRDNLTEQNRRLR